LTSGSCALSCLKLNRARSSSECGRPCEDFNRFFIASLCNSRRKNCQRCAASVTGSSPFRKSCGNLRAKSILSAIFIASLCCHCSTRNKPPFGAGPPGCGKTLALNPGSCFRTGARGRSQRKRFKSALVLQLVRSGHVLLPISPVTKMPLGQTGGVCQVSGLLNLTTTIHISVEKAGETECHLVHLPFCKCV
jgi:hypothetical protein